MPKVYFPIQNRTIEVPYGANLRRAALDNGIDVYGFPRSSSIAAVTASAAPAK